MHSGTHLRSHQAAVPTSIHIPAGERQLQADALISQAAAKIGDHQPGAATCQAGGRGEHCPPPSRPPSSRLPRSLQKPLPGQGGTGLTGSGLIQECRPARPARPARPNQESARENKGASDMKCFREEEPVKSSGKGLDKRLWLYLGNSSNLSCPKTKGAVFGSDDVYWYLYSSSLSFEFKAPINLRNRNIRE